MNFKLICYIFVFSWYMYSVGIFFFMEVVMVLAHTVGGEIMNVLHHGLIFGLGLCAGLAGVSLLVAKRVK